MNQIYSVDRSKWAKLSIFEQMGNIYSEVGRSFDALRRNDKNDCQAAIFRAIDLFDATVDILASKKSPKLKEVLRAKEEYLNTVYDKNASDETIQIIDRYFLQFAVAARLNR